MITVTFYTNFSKRVNSTLRPTGGTNLSVLLKEETSIEKPTFILSGNVSTFTGYNYALWDGRYYYVTDVRIQTNGVVAIDCDMDKLATYKTQIGSSRQFIERCATNHSFEVRDEKIMTTSETFLKNTSGGAFLPASLTSGIIALTLANVAPSKATGGTSDLVYFDSAGGTYGISQLMNALYDNDVIHAIEKIMAKPYDAILSVRYIPGFTTTSLTALTNFSTSNILYFGDWAYSGNINHVQPTGSAPWTYTKSYEFDLDMIAYYSVYKWRNFEPYSLWTMFLPFYGTITIPAAEYIGNNTGQCNLVIKATVDLTTGELIYTRYRKIYVSGVSTTYFAQEYRTSIGVDIPIQSANRDMLAFATDIVTGAGTVALMLATGGAAATAGAIAQGAAAGARAMVDIAQQHILTAGSFNAHGTQIASAEPNDIYITQTGYITQTSPTNYENEVGAPLMDCDTLSNHSGYIKCSNASVDIPGHEEDKNAVNAFLNSGFFYE